MAVAQVPLPHPLHAQWIVNSFIKFDSEHLDRLFVDFKQTGKSQVCFKLTGRTDVDSVTEKSEDIEPVGIEVQHGVLVFFFQHPPIMKGTHKLVQELQVEYDSWLLSQPICSEEILYMNACLLLQSMCRILLSKLEEEIKFIGANNKDMGKVMSVSIAFNALSKQYRCDLHSLSLNKKEWLSNELPKMIAIYQECAVTSVAKLEAKNKLLSSFLTSLDETLKRVPKTATVDKTYLDQLIKCCRRMLNK